MKRIKRYVAGAMAALLLAASSASHAQEKPQAPQTTASTNSSGGVKVSGLGLNTTQYKNGLNTSTVSLTFFTFPKSELWLVGGQDYSREGKNDFDIGLKYVRGGSLLRGTLVSSKDKSGKQKISGGADWDVVLAPYENGGIYLLGDVSSVDKGKKRADFGIGTKFRRKNHNAFFLYSNRGEAHVSTYRTGYMFLDDEKIAALVADYPENGKITFTGYLGLPEHRFIVSYDPNSHDISSVSILTFGNEPLPYYARAVLLSNQFILTQHSVPDSDANHVFQSPFFLEPKGKISDVARFHFSYDTKDDNLRSLYFYNALMVKTQGKQGVVLTQNIDREGGDMYYGGGVGYKFGHATPVVIFQAGDKQRVLFDFNVSY